MDAWKDRIAIVTGGAGAIGAALARAAADRGARVIVTDIDEGRLAAVGAAIPGAETAVLDVRDADAFQALVDDVVRRHGRLDYLFNNAGVGVGGEIQYLTARAWDRVVDVNIRGTMHGVVAAYPVMLRQRSGTIVNTASMAGFSPLALVIPYTMSKHAVLGLSNALRVEGAAYGIRVMALCPGTIDTPMLGARNPSDIPDLDGSWVPNIRRYLESFTGPAYPPDRLARAALRQIDRNKAVIVIPGRARLAAEVARHAPRIAAWGVSRSLHVERKDAGRLPGKVRRPRD